MARPIRPDSEYRNSLYLLKEAVEAVQRVQTTVEAHADQELKKNVIADCHKILGCISNVTKEIAEAKNKLSRFY